MPNVPNAPGVPTLSSYDAPDVDLQDSDGVSPIEGIGSGPQWGVFSNGSSVIAADNVVDFAARLDNPISTYPVEQGAFQSYNKVTLPQELIVSFSAGGSLSNRQAFLQSIDAVMNTTDVYDVVTPEQTYSSYNFVSKSLRRSARNGMGLIVVELHLEEVRIGQQATFSNTQQPGDAGQTANGNPQPQPPSPALQDNITNGTWAVT